MSAPIGPGDWVECVNAESGWTDGDPRLVLGAIYVVEEVAIRRRDPRTGLETVGLYLREVPSHVPWSITRFRPIYRPSESLFLQRLMEVPAPELETV